MIAIVETMSSFVFRSWSSSLLMIPPCSYGVSLAEECIYRFCWQWLVVCLHVSAKQGLVEKQLWVSRHSFKNNAWRYNPGSKVPNARQDWWTCQQHWGYLETCQWWCIKGGGGVIYGMGSEGFWIRERLVGMAKITISHTMAMYSYPMALWTSQH